MKINYLNPNEMKFFNNLIKDIQIIKRNNDVIDKIKILKKDDIIPEIKDNLIRDISERNKLKRIDENIDDLFKNNMLSIMSLDYYNQIKDNPYFNYTTKNLINLNFERIKNYIKNKYIKVTIKEIIPLLKYILDKKDFIKIDNIDDKIKEKIIFLFNKDKEYILFYQNQLFKFDRLKNKNAGNEKNLKIINDYEKKILKSIDDLKIVGNILSNYYKELSDLNPNDTKGKELYLKDINDIEKQYKLIDLVDYIEQYNSLENLQRKDLQKKLDVLNNLREKLKKEYLKIGFDKLKSNDEKLKLKILYEQKDNEIINEGNELIKQYNDDNDDIFTKVGSDFESIFESNIKTNLGDINKEILSDEEIDIGNEDDIPNSLKDEIQIQKLKDYIDKIDYFILNNSKIRDKIKKQFEKISDDDTKKAIFRDFLDKKTLLKKKLIYRIFDKDAYTKTIYFGKDENEKVRGLFDLKTDEKKKETKYKDVLKTLDVMYNTFVGKNDKTYKTKIKAIFLNRYKNSGFNIALEDLKKIDIDN